MRKLIAKNKGGHQTALRSIWTNPVHFIACGFGLGASPIAPGTVGTLGAIPLVLILSQLSAFFYALICLILIIIGVFLCEKTNKDFGTNDHPAAVYDEIATFPLALFLIPVSIGTLIAAFALFRFFDIVKPGPIGWVDEHVHGGFGVMLDDCLAAIATCLVLHLALWFF